MDLHEISQISTSQLHFVFHTVLANACEQHAHMHIHTFCDHQEGNYGPIKNEIFEEGLQVVEGALPKELDGAYVRSR